MCKYENRAFETAQVIEELVQFAMDLRESGAHRVRLGLNDDELAFYDALWTSHSAVQVLGDKQLAVIARELVGKVRKYVTIHRTMRENVRASAGVEGFAEVRLPARS